MGHNNSGDQTIQPFRQEILNGFSINNDESFSNIETSVSIKSQSEIIKQPLLENTSKDSSFEIGSEAQKSLFNLKEEDEKYENVENKFQWCIFFEFLG